MTQYLGKITNFVSAEADDGRNFRDAMVQNRYKLQDAARELLPDYRVSFCLHVPIPQKQIEIWKDTESGHAHIKGVGRCGSVWVCPVCAAHIAIRRRAEIMEGIERAQEQGLQVLFVTLTTRHTRQDSLADNLTRSKAALRFMRKGRPWQRLRDDLGLVGSVDGVEITWGFGAGWHVHYHALYFVSKPVDIGEAENRIYELWSHALDREGLDCDRAHGVKVLRANERAGDYITKWGLENELSSPTKQGKGENFTPFQLLALYEQGEAWAGGLFQEYADATKGLSSLRWSRGLRDKLGMGAEMTDQELAEAEESEQSVLIATLTRDDFKRLIYSGRRGVLGELLMIAERGRDAIEIWLGCYNIRVYVGKNRNAPELPGARRHG